MDVPYEQQFHCRDGTTIANLEQLKAKLESISYQDFYHHVNTEKNDFANWVRYVLKEERLAEDLKKVTSIVETVEIINDYLHPMPVIAPRTDAQSRIEQSILTAPIPSDTSAPSITVQNVPTTQPGAQMGGREEIDFKLIEEKIGLSSNDGDRAGQKAEEELFGKSDAKPQTQAAQTAQQAAPRTRDDLETRLIVKDFVYGLVFGLIVGLILGRII